MAKIPVQDVFKYFDVDEPNPIGKYKQPKKNPNPTGSGYPQTGIDNDNVLVKGRYPSDTKKKERIEQRGAGAAERGTKFHDVSKKRYSVEE